MMSRTMLSVAHMASAPMTVRLRIVNAPPLSRHPLLSKRGSHLTLL